MRYTLVIGLICLGFVGCNRLWPDVNWRDDSYVLMAIDARWQMELDYDCGGSILHPLVLNLVPDTIFAVGSNAEFVVVKQHPHRANVPDPGWEEEDRSVTNYYIIKRWKISTIPTNAEIKKKVYKEFFQRKKENVLGPFSEAEFLQQKKKWNLPGFRTVFTDLE